VKFIKIFSCVVSVFISSLSYANSYIVDFSTSRAYVDSLNNLRAAMGTGMPNINMGGTTVYQLPPQRPGESITGVAIQIRGIDYYNDDTTPNVQFIIDPSNLYITGFVVGSTFYRFSDYTNVSVPGITTNVDLVQDSHYSTLQRVANLSREGMSISRETLRAGYLSLINFNGNNLNQDSARSLLRYATVISESARFRQIQRHFRTTLDLVPTAYQMSIADRALTNSWDPLSGLLPSVDEVTAPGVRVSGIELPNIQAILTTVALALHCQGASSRNKRSIDTNSNDEQCSINDNVIINKVIWDKATLISVVE
jgi:shiga toxin subunit A